MVFGGTEDERLQVNESTLWGGGPQSYTNLETHIHLDEVRQLISAGRYSVSIGGGQPNTEGPALAGTFEVKGTKTLPE